MIKTPNVKIAKKDVVRELAVNRKPCPDMSDFERYADIIFAYRELLRKTALAYDIELGLHGRCTVPHDRDKIVQWVQDPKNLDLVTEAFRRVCSGYVSTARLFSIHAGPYYMDWPAVHSMLKVGYDSVLKTHVFMDLSGKGLLEEECHKLEKALDLIREVQDSVRFADMLGSLPSPSERMGLEEAEQ